MPIRDSTDWDSPERRDSRPPTPFFLLAGMSLAVLVAMSVVLSGGAAVAEAPSGAVASQPSEVGLLAWGSSFLPGVGSISVLNAVSCVSANFCVAVGYSQNPLTMTSTTFIETWNGTTWSIASSPNPGDMTNQLAGVSCSNPTSCVAVGYSNNSAAPYSPATVIETWNGTAWSVTSSPEGVLNAVSCLPSTTSTTFCVAVGEGTGASNLIETWNGIAWSVTPSPAGAHLVDGVSCVTSSECVAVGNYFTGTTDQNLIESWDGSSWSITPSPPAGGGSQLSGVFCINLTSCVAVGESTNDVATPSTLTELWNGSDWSISSSLNPGTNGNLLNGVTCISSIECVAVGVTSPTAPLIENWNGATWSLAPSANSDDSNVRLTSVSCISSIYCSAVGLYHETGTATTTAQAESLFGITSTSLPPGNIGTPYSQTLVAVGGNSPYAWKVVSGSLPHGLHLDKATGTISGRPGKRSTTSTFTVQVTDTKKLVNVRPHTINTASATFTITIS
jgi:hypothetical protein